MTKKLSLNYDQLKKNYYNQLNNKLRDFGTDYLKLWVPDDNLIKSFLNLLNSIATQYKNFIEITISKKTLDSQSLKDLESISKQFSEINISENNDLYFLNFNKINSIKINEKLILFSRKKKHKNIKILKKRKSEKKQFSINTKKIKKLYFKKIKNFKFKKIKNELIDNKFYDYFVNNKKYGLAIKLDPQEKLKIISINFCGDDNDIEIFFLEEFCRKILNLPLFEAFEHGIIKLEKSIRPRNLNKYIEGIISPVSRFQIFENIHDLISKIWKLHKIKHNVELKNLFDRYPSDNWMNLSFKKKEEIINNSIKNFEKKNNIDNLLYFDTIQDDCIRLTVGVKKKINDDQLSSILLFFEKFVRTSIDKRIEVFYTELRDENKLRQKNLKL